jgi:hypothetical protein
VWGVSTTDDDDGQNTHWGLRTTVNLGISYWMIRSTKEVSIICAALRTTRMSKGKTGCQLLVQGLKGGTGLLRPCGVRPAEVLPFLALLLLVSLSLPLVTSL